MKSILTSIQPYYVFLIIARTMGWRVEQEKTVEVRKNFPRAQDWNKKSLIYCSRDRRSFNRIPKEYQPLMISLLGKVIGEFVCDEIKCYEGEFWDNETYECVRECYEPDDFEEYGEYEYETIADNEQENYKDVPLFKQSCLTWEGLREYLGKGDHVFYGWHISDLKIYGKPKELWELCMRCKVSCAKCKDPAYYNPFVAPGCEERGVRKLMRPPQSWMYVEEL